MFKKSLFGFVRGESPDQRRIRWNGLAEEVFKRLNFIQKWQIRNGQHVCVDEEVLMEGKPPVKLFLFRCSRPGKNGGSALNIDYEHGHFGRTYFNCTSCEHPIPLPRGA